MTTGSAIMNITQRAGSLLCGKCGSFLLNSPTITIEAFPLDDRGEYLCPDCGELLAFTFPMPDRVKQYPEQAPLSEIEARLESVCTHIETLEEQIQVLEAKEEGRERGENMDRYTDLLRMEEFAALKQQVEEIIAKIIPIEGPKQPSRQWIRNGDQVILYEDGILAHIFNLPSPTKEILRQQKEALEVMQRASVGTGSYKPVTFCNFAPEDGKRLENKE